MFPYPTCAYQYLSSRQIRRDNNENVGNSTVKTERDRAGRERFPVGLGRDGNVFRRQNNNETGRERLSLIMK